MSTSDSTDPFVSLQAKISPLLEIYRPLTPQVVSRPGFDRLAHLLHTMREEERFKIRKRYRTWRQYCAWTLGESEQHINYLIRKSAKYSQTTESTPNTGKNFNFTKSDFGADVSLSYLVRTARRGFDPVSSPRNMGMNPSHLPSTREFDDLPIFPFVRSILAVKQLIDRGYFQYSHTQLTTFCKQSLYIKIATLHRLFDDYQLYQSAQHVANDPSLLYSVQRRLQDYLTVITFRKLRKAGKGDGPNHLLVTLDNQAKYYFSRHRKAS